MNKSKSTRYIILFSVLIILLIGAIILGICTGTVHFSMAEIFNALFKKEGTDVAVNVFWEIRFPRVLAAVLLGGALSVSGFLLQTFFHNPIAGPFVLGISSSAKLIVCITMIFFMGGGYLGSGAMILAAFLGSLLATFFVLAVSKYVPNMSVLIICGVMIGYITSAVTDILVNFADDSNIVNLHNWSLGSFSGISWRDIRYMTVVIIIAMILIIMISKPMSAYQLGDSYAANSGVNVKAFKVILILLSSILSATVTAFAGPVSFVGIAIPHLIKSIFKTSKPIIIVPASFLGGSFICVISDTIARSLFSPTELSISSVTSVFLAPVVIYMMLRRKGAGNE